MMRTMIFGTYVAAQNYAREHSLTPKDWMHGSSPIRILGLNTNEFKTVVIGETLDAAATEALRQWEFRRQLYGGKPEGEGNCA